METETQAPELMQPIPFQNEKKAGRDGTYAAVSTIAGLLVSSYAAKNPALPVPVEVVTVAVTGAIMAVLKWFHGLIKHGSATTTK